MWACDVNDDVDDGDDCRRQEGILSFAFLLFSAAVAASLWHPRWLLPIAACMYALTLPSNHVIFVAGKDASWNFKEIRFFSLNFSVLSFRCIYLASRRKIALARYRIVLFSDATCHFAVTFAFEKSIRYGHQHHDMHQTKKNEHSFGKWQWTVAGYGRFTQASLSSLCRGYRLLNFGDSCLFILSSILLLRRRSALINRSSGLSLAMAWSILFVWHKFLSVTSKQMREGASLRRPMDAPHNRVALHPVC